MTTDRISRVEDWWEGSFPGLMHCDLDVEGCLREAFLTVLSKLSEEHFDQFTERSPTILCVTDAHAVVVLYFRRLREDEEDAELVVIYFESQTVKDRSADELVDSVAHEVAHVVLGHYKGGPSQADQEGEADALSTSWGSALVMSGRKSPRCGKPSGGELFWHTGIDASGFLRVWQCSSLLSWAIRPSRPPSGI